MDKSGGFTALFGKRGLFFNANIFSNYSSLPPFSPVCVTVVKKGTVSFFRCVLYITWV